MLGLVQGFDFPARSSIFPALIEPHQMMSAVALNSILWQGTRMILPGIGGVLIAIADTALVFGLCALGFVAMVCVLVTIKVDQSFSRTGKPWREFLEGVKFVIANQLFRTLIILTFSMHFFVTSYIQIMPIFADLLGSGERGYGLLISITGVGSLIGTLSIARFQQSRRLGWVIFISSALSPSVLLGFALLTSVPVTGEVGFIFASIFVVLSAAFGGAFLVGSMTVLQLIVPDSLRGRVMGIHSITFSLIALGGLMTGGLASTLSAPIAVTIGSSVALIVVFWAMMRHKEIWRLDGRRL
jgi:predicted MFS family arabinose efflux permease